MKPNSTVLAGSAIAAEEAARVVLARRRLPAATYRLQFGPLLTFSDARRLVPYLSALGISDVYASPLLKPCRGSSHGYDVCGHRALNPALGSEDDFDRLSAELRRRDMGLVFDVVPNHMGIADPANNWWMDVLEDGPSSAYASFFDVDWHPLRAEADLENKVLLPILGDPYGKALENQDIRLGYEDGAFFISYFEHRMPVTPRSYADILSARLDDLAVAPGDVDLRRLELQSIITAIHHLPPETRTDSEAVAERQREKVIIKRRLAQLVAESSDIRAAIEATVAAYNGRRGDRHSFDDLDRLLSQQRYRLAYWRVAAEEINYRRFFDINDLAAIRMENPVVFAETHRLILRLVREGKATGLRIDHADGLWDPAGYLEQLQRAAFSALSQDWLDARVGLEGGTREAAEASVLAWFDAERAADPDAPIARPLYVVVEKILGYREDLPASWPVHGTTGYDFANQVNGLFVDGANRKALDDVYMAFIRDGLPSYADLVNSTKKMIMLVSLASEINDLASQLKRIARKNRWYRDLTLNSLTHAVREVIAALPIYRTYLANHGARVAGHDRAAIDVAVAEARRRNPRTASAVFDFVRAVLLQQYPDDAMEEEQAEWSSFVRRFQQTSGPVMAKGVEDTAFYVYNRLVALNEVGGNPEHFGVTPAEFHRLNLIRQKHWPYTMLAGSTHDSKRSADVRARLDVLSELPKTWRQALVAWGRRNRNKKTLVDGRPAPDRNEEYLLYQTLLGAWPLGELDEATLAAFRHRIQEYTQKALKEAKVHTSWVNPNQAYDDAVARFVDALLTPGEDGGFLASFRPMQELIAFHGMLNGLSQTLLQLTSPGVPDIFQGTELWELSLVDPDNRRPVDFERRRRLLDELRQWSAPLEGGQRVAAVGPRRAAAAGGRASAVVDAPGRPTDPSNLRTLAAELLDHWADGRIKLWVTHRALGARHAHPDLFTIGAYRPAELGGAHWEHAVAFLRSDGTNACLTVAPRLGVSLTGQRAVLPLGEAIWEDTSVAIPDGAPDETWRNLLTGETLAAVELDGRAVLPLAKVFRTLPVALLERIRPGDAPASPPPAFTAATRE